MFLKILFSLIVYIYLNYLSSEIVNDIQVLLELASVRRELKVKPVRQQSEKRIDSSLNH
jgi:hypothetical protein